MPQGAAFGPQKDRAQTSIGGGGATSGGTKGPGGSVAAALAHIAAQAAAPTKPAGGGMAPQAGNANMTYHTGNTPFISDPSAGQIVGALMSGLPIGGLMNTGMGVAKHLLAGDTLNGATPYDGGAMGQAIDKFRGVTPGAVTGFNDPTPGTNNADRRNGAPPSIGQSVFPNAPAPSPAGAPAVPGEQGFNIQAWLQKILGAQGAPPTAQPFGNSIMGVAA